MKQKSKLVAGLVVVLVLVCAVAAAVHLTTRVQVPELSVLIEGGGVRKTISLDGRELEQVVGQAKTQKGTALEINAPGILLRDLLAEAGLGPDQARILADDGYSALVTGEEIAEEDKVYLLRQEDDTLRLIVFGDENSKRNVNRVAQIRVGAANES